MSKLFASLVCFNVVLLVFLFSCMYGGVITVAWHPSKTLGEDLALVHTDLVAAWVA